MSQLSNLPNIGAVLTAKLHAAGITNSKELIEIGSKEAFRRIRASDEGACLSMLYALEGAVQGVRWHRVAKQVKDELKEYYRALAKE